MKLSASILVGYRGIFLVCAALFLVLDGVRHFSKGWMGYQVLVWYCSIFLVCAVLFLILMGQGFSKWWMGYQVLV